MRASGKSAGTSVEVVYLPTGDSKVEFDRFVLREAGGWWAMPHMASGSLGARARKHFAVNGVPHAVVTEFKDGFVKVVNPDAAADIANDPKGASFPWQVKSVDQMLGPVLVDKDKKRHKREKKLAACSVLAIYLCPSDVPQTPTSANPPTSSLSHGVSHSCVNSGGEWCPHCISFKPTVDKAYAALKEEYNDEWEMVYVSSDNDQKAFDRYFGSMDWYSVPYDSKPIKEALDRHFKVRHRDHQTSTHRYSSLCTQWPILARPSLAGDRDSNRSDPKERCRRVVHAH